MTKPQISAKKVTDALSACENAKEVYHKKRKAYLDTQSALDGALEVWAIASITYHHLVEEVLNDQA